MFLTMIAAKEENLEDYSWSVYNSNRPYTLESKPGSYTLNRKHKQVTFKKGDLFGVRFTRSKTVNLLKEEDLHIKYSFPMSDEKTYKALMRRSVPYTGKTPEKQEIEAGYKRRRRKVNPKATVKPNRLTADYFWREKEPDEKDTIDKENYQWRKIKSGTPSIRITTHARGKTKAILKAGEVVGLRFYNNSRGGYLLLEDNTRIQIRRELYDDIIQGSKVLPVRLQRAGVIDKESRQEINKNVNKRRKAAEDTDAHGRRRRKVRQAEIDYSDMPEDEQAEPYSFYDVDEMDKKRRVSSRKSIKNFVDKLFNVDDLDTLNSEEVADMDFEDEPDTEKASKVIDNEPEEMMDELPDDSEFDDIESEEPEEDIEEEEDEDSEDDEPALDFLEPGTIFTTLTGNENTYVVVEAEPSEKLDRVTQLLLHDINSDEEDVLYRMNLKDSFTLGKFKEKARIEDEVFDVNELRILQDNIEYSTIRSKALGK